jgi:hypothetical protein
MQNENRRFTVKDMKEELSRHKDDFELIFTEPITGDQLIFQRLKQRGDDLVQCEFDPPEPDIQF